MNNNVFYHVYTASSTPCYLTKEADADAKCTWLCPDCCSPKPGVMSVDVKLRLAPDSADLNFVFGAGVPIASRSFLECLGEDLVRRDLHIGRILGPDGRDLDDWVTVRGKTRLLVRGSKNAQHRQCVGCHTTLYFAMGKSYLYPCPSFESSVFESNLWGLVLSESVFLQSDCDKLKGVYVDKIKVANNPKDTFGDLT